MSKKVYVCYWDNGETYEDHETGVAAICTTEKKARQAAEVYLSDLLQTNLFHCSGYSVDVVEQELNLFVYNQYEHVYTGRYITQYEFRKNACTSELTIQETSR